MCTMQVDHANACLLQGRFVLEEKGIPYKKVFINLAGGETSSPWYMKTVNINGVVRLKYDVVNCFRQLYHVAQQVLSLLRILTKF